MTNNGKSIGNGKPVLLVVFAIMAFVALGCNLSKFTGGGNASNSAPPGTTGSTALCSNGYYPVGPSIVRKYHVIYPKGMLTDRDYTESFSDFSGDTFTVNTDFGTV